MVVCTVKLKLLAFRIAKTRPIPESRQGKNLTGLVSAFQADITLHCLSVTGKFNFVEIRSVW